MGFKALPCTLSSLALLTSLSLPYTRAGSSGEDGSKCTCYITNGHHADGHHEDSYFSWHKLYDFRSLSKYQNVPQLLQEGSATSTALTTSDYFNQDSWTSFWEIQNWNNSQALENPSSGVGIMRINSRNNVYIEKNTDPNPTSETWLTLRTARQDMFQSAAEMVTLNDSYQFLSMRMMARTVGAPGGCTAMFTYLMDRDLQEVDLEVLTKYPKNQVQCTNQPAMDGQGQLKSEATKNVTLPDGATWQDWAVYRLDWTPGRSTWYVNGKELTSIEFQTPRDPSRIHLNAWSDGGNWTGKMPVKGEAHLQIQWWEIIYNNTLMKRDKSMCSVGCSIDNAQSLGQPNILFDNVASRPGQTSLVGWLPSVAMLVMFAISSSLFQF